MWSIAATLVVGGVTYVSWPEAPAVPLRYQELFTAVRYGTPERVEALINEGLDPNFQPPRRDHLGDHGAGRINSKTP